MDNKKILIVIISLIFICLGFLFFGVKSNYSDEYKLAEVDLISTQEDMNKKIKTYSKSSAYTIENPKIIKNPYKISPLTALIIFKTKEELEIKVLVNDEEIGSTKKESDHIIPIYYLKPNYDNIVKLVCNDKTYEYKITPKVNMSKTKMDEITVNNTDNKYMLSSSMSDLYYSLFNKDGELIWYLDLASQGKIEKLNNGNFIVGVEEYRVDNNVSNFTGIYEMDYLGKIIKRIDSKYMYHHSFKVVDNFIYVAGTSSTTHQMSMVYKMDLDTGEILDTYDLYDMFIEIDPNFEEVNKKLDHGFGLNSIDINMDTKELLVSLRSLNSIVCIDLNNKSIKWMIGDKSIFGAMFDGYFINDESVTIPRGAHDATFINSNTISYYNNNYDEFNYNGGNIKDFNLGALGIILNVDGGKVKEINKYSKENKMSYAFGSIRRKNNNTLINYSYLFKDEAINKNVSLFDHKGNTYSNLVLYNEADEIIFDAKIDDEIYYASTFEIPKYKTSYVLSDYKYINNYDESFLVNKSKLKKNNKYLDTLVINKNSFVFNVDTSTYDEMYVIFKSDKIKSFKYQKCETYYSLEKGVYEIYIFLDGTYYNISTKLRVN